MRKRNNVFLQPSRVDDIVLLFFETDERPPRPEQPSPPECYPGPASIHFAISKILDSTTFVTIRFAKEGEKYQVYDWRTKQLMKRAGNAIPVEEFHKMISGEILRSRW